VLTQFNLRDLPLLTTKADHLAKQGNPAFLDWNHFEADAAATLRAT